MNKLYRIRKGKIFFGVCGGLAKCFNVDAKIVRLLFMIAIFLINGYLQEKGLDACVGINELSALTSGFLGLPGVALLYGVRVYLMG